MVCVALELGAQATSGGTGDRRGGVYHRMTSVKGTGAGVESGDLVGSVGRKAFLDPLGFLLM